MCGSGLLGKLHRNSSRESFKNLPGVSSDIYIQIHSRVLPEILTGNLLEISSEILFMIFFQRFLVRMLPKYPQRLFQSSGIPSDFFESFSTIYNVYKFTYFSIILQSFFLEILPNCSNNFWSHVWINTWEKYWIFFLRYLFNCYKKNMRKFWWNSGSNFKRKNAWKISEKIPEDTCRWISVNIILKI